MTDGPLIVQSDKTLLLEVDHPTRSRVPARRSRRSPSSSAPRARAHLPADAARPVERPRRRPRRRAGRRRAADASAATPCRTRCSSTSPTRWPATAGCGSRSTRSTAWSCARPTGRCSRRSLRNKKIAPMLGARLDDDTVVVHPVRARPPQAGAAQARLAGRGPGRLRRRRGAPDRARRGRLGAAGLPAGGRRGLLARRLRRRRAALRRRQDAGRRGRDGAAPRRPR